MKGIIYSITSNDKLYIGSTERTLKERIREHKCFDLYGMDRYNCEIKVLEEIEYIDKKELRQREQYHIDNNNCVNKLRANGLTKKEYDKLYYEKNKERLIRKSSEYQKSDKAKKYSSEYHKKNYKYDTNEYYYKISWGGDPRYNNNLLRIDINIFS